MEITVAYEEEIPVLTMTGRFDAGGALAFDKTALTVEGKIPFWVLDLSQVSFLSSIGLRSLVTIEKNLKSREGGIILTGVTPLVLELLQVSSLDGLLRRTSTRKQAIVLAVASTSSGPAVEHEAAGCRLRIYRLPKSSSSVEWWDGSSAGESNAQRLQPIALEDLGFAFGTGLFGEISDPAQRIPEAFFSTPFFAGVRLAEADGVSDFITRGVSESVPVQVARALGIAGTPSHVVEANGPQPFRLLDLLDGLFPIANRQGAPPPILGFVVMGESPAAGGGILAIGLAIEPVGAAPLDQASHLRNCAGQIPLPSGRLAMGGAVTLSPGEKVSAGVALSDAVNARATIDTLQRVVGLAEISLLSQAVIWLFLPDSVDSGAEKLLQVTHDGPGEWRAEWDIIARRLYSDCRSVNLTPLHGGFMSKTFRAVAYDRDGRRTLPTVVKIGPNALTAREEQANRQYVARFILNNGTTLLGGAQAGEWAGLRYNFLGVNGPESRLVWLREHYLSRPVPEVLGLFEKLISRVLKPWYAQPKWEQVCLYQDHTPLRLFPTLIETAEKVLGVSADVPSFDCPELGQELPNPFHFLKHEYPKRAAQSRLWYTTICHGDLNMQNVLVDERDNLYVIDFSETGPRNAASDFARLEPILKFEMIRLETDEDLRLLLEFEAGLTSVTRLSDPPPLHYRGDDPNVARAHAVIAYLRRCADTVTLFEQDLIPYWLALLEWTYSVVCYTQLSFRQKRYAACSAALICRSIRQLEGAP